MPSFDFARFSPFSWFWLKPLSVNLPMSLTRAAVNELLCAAGVRPPPSAALDTTVATSAAIPANRIQRFTCPPQGWFVGADGIPLYEQGLDERIRISPHGVSLS